MVEVVPYGVSRNKLTEGTVPSTSAGAKSVSKFAAAASKTKREFGVAVVCE